MARVKGNILNGFNPSLTLDRYQEIMHIPIAAFNGLNNPDEYVMDECSRIWTQSERNLLAQWLAVAEERRERELGYHLAPKFIVDEEHDYPCTGDVILSGKHLIAVGTQVVELISTESITYRDLYTAIIDPVVLSVTTDVTDEDDICVFYPGEDVRITPSSISISGGVATIEIPRSRLVKPSKMDDRKDKLYYVDDDNFLETVDVKHCYMTISNAINLVWSSAALARIGRQCQPGCNEETQSACSTVHGERAKRISNINIYPATFSGETPTGTRLRYGCGPDYVRVSYLSGVQWSPYQELLTARYAHTLMPTRPCSCPLVEQFWLEDRKEAKFVTPYGATMGAQDAWMADSRAKIGIGGAFS